ITASICSDVNSSPNAGMIREKPRPPPPCVTVAFQSTSSSGVVLGQSVKSGNVDGLSKPTVVCDSPSPCGPWQPAQPLRKIASPEVSVRATDGGAGGCPAAAGAATHTPKEMIRITET